MTEFSSHQQPADAELGVAPYESLRALATLAVKTVELAELHAYHGSQILSGDHLVNIDSRYYFGYQPPHLQDDDQRVVFGEKRLLTDPGLLIAHAEFDELTLHREARLPVIAGDKDQFLAAATTDNPEPINRVYEYQLEYVGGQDHNDVSQSLSVAYYPLQKVETPPYAVGGYLDSTADLGLRNYQVNAWTSRIAAFSNYISS